MRIGILALQGDFIEHISILKKLGVESIPVRKSDELKDLDGLIFPGGESTTITNLMYSFDLFKPLKRLVQTGLPIMGTCAGTVLMAKKVANFNMATLALMDMEVRRNAFGRQVASFETKLTMPVLGNKLFPAIFIRAPLILSAGSGVEVLARLDNGAIVAARQGSNLAIAFHPELSSDLRLHGYFLKIVTGYQSTAQDGIYSEAKKLGRKAPIPAD